MRRTKIIVRKSGSRATGRRVSTTAVTGIPAVSVLEPLMLLFDAVGVSRREVLATIRSLPTVKLPVRFMVVRGQLEYWSRTLTRWAADPQFLGSDGRPRDLAFVAGDPSFSDLVNLELPGERPAACRDTLLAAGAIVRLPNGQLRWRERTALAFGASSGILLADEYLQPLRALLVVLQSNLQVRARGGPEPEFQRAVSGYAISPEDADELFNFVDRHGTALLETVDDWLAQRQQELHRSGRTVNVSVRPYLGLFLDSDSGYSRSRARVSKRRSIVKAVRKKRSKMLRS